MTELKPERELSYKKKKKDKKISYRISTIYHDNKYKNNNEKNNPSV